MCFSVYKSMIVEASLSYYLRQYLLETLYMGLSFWYEYAKEQPFVFID